MKPTVNIFNKDIAQSRWLELSVYIRKTLKERTKPRGSAKDVLILTHNNPDPDAIASAWGLKALLSHIHISSRIAYSGIIGRPENRAMVDLLKIEMSKMNRLTLEAYPMIALTDTQPGTGNNSLPKGKIPDLVLDHHPRRDCTNHVPFADIHLHIFGSTSSMITHYIMASGLKITKKLATALYYGIKTDTQDLGRDSKEADLMAARFLYPNVLSKTLAKIEHPRKSLTYFTELINALTKTVICQDLVLVDAGKVSTPDILSQIVDFLISIENVKWAISVAEIGDEIDFSIRTDFRGRRAGRLAQLISRGMGTAGGHDMTAGGQIPFDNPHTAKIIKERLFCRFLKKLKRDITLVQQIFSESNSS